MFADELRQTVKEYNNSVDEVIVDYIKNKCKDAAKEGKSYVYIDNKLSQATKEVLERREGLKLVIAATSLYTYQVNW
jgi:hypothetical protein